MTHNAQPILQVCDLKKAFPIKKGVIRVRKVGEVRAVNDVSFTLDKGETLGVIGESGCGKSTLARLVLGIIEKDGGDILLDGKPVSTQMPSSMRRNVQMIFQDPYLSIDPRMNIRRIIEEPLRVYTKLNAREKLDTLRPILGKVGLSDDVLEKYPHEFSGGQRQRIGIARALVLNPALVLCDEPVSALDVSIQAQILNLFKHLQQELGLTYLFISHDMSVIRHVSDRIAVMYLGNIVELATKRTLFSHTLHPYSIALMSAIPVPDPSLRRKRILLEGDLPSPLDLPRGCPFASRCMRMKPCCEEEKPVLREVEAGHFVACHFIDGEGEA